MKRLFILCTLAFLATSTDLYANQLQTKQKICNQTINNFKKYFYEMTEKIVYEKYRLHSSEQGYYYSGQNNWFPKEEKETTNEIINEIIESNIFYDFKDNQNEETLKKDIETIVNNRQHIIDGTISLDNKENELKKILLKYNDKFINKIKQKADSEVSMVINSISITTKAYPNNAFMYTNYYNNEFSKKSAKCSAIIKLKRNSNLYKHMANYKKEEIKMQVEQSFFGPYIEGDYNKEIQKWYDTLLDMDNQIATMTYIEEIVNSIEF